MTPWTMDDQQVWEALARAIARGGVISPDRPWRWKEVRGFYGLCAALDGLVSCAEMPRDEARRRFCLRMAKLAKRDGGNHET